MTSTEQLEREAELTRAQLSASLDELRTITPGRLVDEILGYAKSGSAELIRGLGHQVVEHPLPATLIGAGLAWLIMSNTSSNGSARAWDGHARPSTGNWFSEAGRSASSTAENVGDRAGSAMRGMRDNVQSAVAGAGDKLDSATEAVKDRAQAAMSGLSNTASGIGDSISDAYGSVVQAAASVTPSQDEIMQAGQRVWDYCKDQPLVVAGIGLAIGAALGAAIPQTEAENRLMGETADDLKQKAQNLVSEPLETANRVMKSVGQKALDEATKFAKQEVSDLVSGVGSSGQSSPQSDEQQGTDMGQDSNSSMPGGTRPFH